MVGLFVPMPSLGALVERADAAAPAEDPHRRINDQIALADAARRAGRITEAASLYADAYHMTAGLADYRASDVALDLALLSAALHREAFEASGGDHVLCERSRDLLREVADDWKAAGQPVPPAVLDELRWAEDRLVEVQRPAEREPEREPEPEPEAEPASVVPPAVPPDLGASQGHARPTMPANATEPPRPGKRLGIALVASGATSTVVSAVLLAVGAPLPGRARAYRTEVLESAEFAAWGSDQQAIVAGHLDRYVAAEQRRGLALVATGGAILGMGAAAVVVGSLRWARVRRSRGTSAASHRILPRASVGRGTAMLGLSLSLRWR